MNGNLGFWIDCNVWGFICVKFSLYFYLKERRVGLYYFVVFRFRDGWVCGLVVC